MTQIGDFNAELHHESNHTHFQMAGDWLIKIHVNWNAALKRIWTAVAEAIPGYSECRTRSVTSASSLMAGVHSGCHDVVARTQPCETMKISLSEMTILKAYLLGREKRPSYARNWSWMRLQWMCFWVAESLSASASIIWYQQRSRLGTIGINKVGWVAETWSSTKKQPFRLHNRHCS